MEKMSSTSGKKRPASPMDNYSKKIRVMIKAQIDGSETRTEVPGHVSCARVFKTFCESKDLDYKSVVFLYCGKRICKRSRAIETIALGEDEIEIDAMEHMPGGG